MPAVAPHDTATTEREWDGPAAVAAAPSQEATLRHMHAWRDPDGDRDVKSTWSLPHHGPRQGSAAVLPAVRNALARLPQSNIPQSDRAAVERHLRGHLNE